MVRLLRLEEQTREPLNETARLADQHAAVERAKQRLREMDARQRDQEGANHAA